MCLSIYLYLHLYLFDRAKREQLETCKVLLPESQGQHLAWTVLFVPSSLDSESSESTDVRAHERPNPPKPKSGPLGSVIWVGEFGAPARPKHLNPESETQSPQPQIQT